MNSKISKKPPAKPANQPVKNRPERRALFEKATPIFKNEIFENKFQKGTLKRPLFRKVTFLIWPGSARKGRLDPYHREPGTTQGRAALAARITEPRPIFTAAPLGAAAYLSRGLAFRGSGRPAGIAGLPDGPRRS